MQTGLRFRHEVDCEPRRAACARRPAASPGWRDRPAQPHTWSGRRSAAPAPCRRAKRRSPAASALCRRGRGRAPGSRRRSVRRDRRRAHDHHPSPRARRSRSQRRADDARRQSRRSPERWRRRGKRRNRCGSFSASAFISSICIAKIFPSASSGAFAASVPCSWRSAATASAITSSTPMVLPWLDAAQRAQDRLVFIRKRRLQTIEEPRVIRHAGDGLLDRAPRIRQRLRRQGRAQRRRGRRRRGIGRFLRLRLERRALARLRQRGNLRKPRLVPDRADEKAGTQHDRDDGGQAEQNEPQLSVQV